MTSRTGSSLSIEVTRSHVISCIMLWHRDSSRHDNDSHESKMRSAWPELPRACLAASVAVCMVEQSSRLASLHAVVAKCLYRSPVPLLVTRSAQDLEYLPMCPSSERTLRVLACSTQIKEVSRRHKTNCKFYKGLLVHIWK
jgi:hypothetical protein